MNAVTLVTILASMLGADQTEIQGVWNETSPAQRYSLIFCGDVLMGAHNSDVLTDAKLSTFRINAQAGTIDIDREEGVQLGRYKIDGDTLTLVLANVNKPRPASVEPAPVVPRARAAAKKDRPQVGQLRYVLKR